VIYILQELCKTILQKSCKNQNYVKLSCTYPAKHVIYVNNPQNYIFKVSHVFDFLMIFVSF